jgi:DNA-binding MarR family transcriptional regulator
MSRRPNRARQPAPSLASLMHRLELEVNQAVLARLRRQGFEGIRASQVAFVDQMGAGCRMSELARRLNLSPGAVTQMSTQLEGMGLVARRMDPADRRAVIVEPTESVRAMWGVAREVVDRVEQDWGHRLQPGQLAQLEAILNALVEPGLVGAE